MATLTFFSYNSKDPAVKHLIITFTPFIYTKNPYYLLQCAHLNGEVRIETTAVTGLGYTQHKIACYPKGRTNDAGESCKTFTMAGEITIRSCESECIWLGGDIILEGSSYQCSAYKKPLFIIAED